MVRRVYLMVCRVYLMVRRVYLMHVRSSRLPMLSALVPAAGADPLTPGRDGFARASRRRVGGAGSGQPSKRALNGRVLVSLHRDPRCRALTSHGSPPDDVLP